VTKKLIIVLGPTAVGKTELSIELAQKYGSPVISCDSRQIYKEMTIGTAVPSAAQLSAVQHYFIQTKSILDYYTAGLYEAEAMELIRRLFDEGHDTLIMTGGSMFYIDAVCNSLDHIPTADLSVRASLQETVEKEGQEYLMNQLRVLDPKAFASIDLSNKQRLFRAVEVCLSTGMPYSSFKDRVSKAQRGFEIQKIGLTRPRDILYDRINRRVLDMIDRGLIEEAGNLYQFKHTTALQTVGYKEIFEYIEGSVNIESAVANIQKNTRHYAKRQMTWWRRDPGIEWHELA